MIYDRLVSHNFLCVINAGERNVFQKLLSKREG